MRLSTALFCYLRRPRSFNYVDKFRAREDRRFAKRHEYVLKPFATVEQGDDRRAQFSQSDVKVGRFEFPNPYDVRNTQHEQAEEELRKKPPREKVPLPYHVTMENRFDLLNQVVMPLHLLNYPSQLKAKHGALCNLMAQYGSLLRRTKSPVILDDSGFPCPLFEPVASTKDKQYRNKDEFTIWPGLDGNPKTVGFLLGEPSKHENVFCVEPTKTFISKSTHRMLASLFQKYLTEHSPYSVCTNLAGGGHWRRFVVRSNEAGEHMIVCMMHPQNLTTKELDEEKERIRSYFQDSSIANDFKSVSAYFQTPTGVRQANDEAPFQLLFGEESLKENIFGLNCVISPESFFQVNTLAAEKLYDTVLEQIEPTRDMTVIDCCSGVGILSMATAKLVRRVIAIEQSAQAVKDAKRNAALNKINNIHFINGKVEEALPRLTDEFYDQKVVIILNPGRGGLHHSAISSIRSFDPVSRVVYISCKPAGASLKNFVHLAMKSTRDDPGLPLLPISAIPVDMFPHTEHCELVMTFDRFL